LPDLVEVVAGLIQDGARRYLITQRRGSSHLAGMWEFPGGKREAGESLEDALRRELTEELSARFEVGERVETVRWEYPERTVVIHFYRCRHESGTIEPQESLLVFSDIESALSFSNSLTTDLFVIGGAQIYEAFLPHIEKWIITEVPLTVTGADAFMPKGYLDGFEVNETKSIGEDLIVKFYQR